MNAPGSFPVRCHNPVAADIDVTDNCFCTVFFAGLYLSSSFNKTAIIFYKNNEVFVNCDMYLQSRRFASPHRAGNAGCPTRSIRQAPSSFREKWHLLERSNNLAPPSPLPPPPYFHQQSWLEGGWCLVWGKWLGGFWPEFSTASPVIA